MRTQARTKKNPDPISTFASLAGGIASTLTITELMKRRKTSKPATRRGIKAAKRNPRAVTKRVSSPSLSKGNAKPNPRKGGKKPTGTLYVLTIGRGDDIETVYLHDGKGDGFSKKFRSMAGAKSFATRNKVKLAPNPVPGYIDSKGVFHASSPVTKTKGRSLVRWISGRERPSVSSMTERQKIEKMAEKYLPGVKKQHPRWSVGRQRKEAIALVEKLVKDNPAKKKRVTRRAKPARRKVVAKRRVQKPARSKGTVSRRTRKNPVVRKAATTVRRKRNTKSIPRRRTFESFQGRPATTAKRLEVSQHAPARMDQLGDLVELKINGMRDPLKFGRGVVLAAANGKLWIAGKRFAKPNPSSPAHVLNPIGEIDYVVYGTRKPHHGDHEYTHYKHMLADEGGTFPVLAVDREGYPVIHGGTYKIRPEGIRD